MVTDSMQSPFLHMNFPSHLPGFASGGNIWQSESSTISNVSNEK